MTEYEKMLHNLPYDYTDKEVQANILRAYYAMRDLNQCGAWDMDELHRCIHALIPDAHPSVIICRLSIATTATAFPSVRVRLSISTGCS